MIVTPVPYLSSRAGAGAADHGAGRVSALLRGAHRGKLRLKRDTGGSSLMVDGSRRIWLLPPSLPPSLLNVIQVARRSCLMTHGSRRVAHAFLRFTEIKG